MAAEVREITLFISRGASMAIASEQRLPDLRAFLDRLRLFEDQVEIQPEAEVANEPESISSEAFQLWWKSFIPVFDELLQGARVIER